MRQLMLCVYKWCWAKKKTFFFLRRLARSVGIIGKSNFLRLAPKRTGESGARKLPALTIMIVGHQGRPFEGGGSRNPGPDSKTGHCATGPQRIRRANRKTSLALWPNYRTILIVVRTRDGLSRDSQSLIRTDSPNLHPQEPRQSRLSRRTTQLV